MSTAEVIEQIKSLPAEEQVRVADFVCALKARSASARASLERQKALLEAHLAEINLALEGGRDSLNVDVEFKRIADHIFTKNAELFRKLAQ